MKHAVLSLTAGLLLSLSLTVTATTLYVDANNPAPVPPYTNWVTAATNIQDAVDAAVDGDQVLVTNGVYEAGAQVIGGMSNRVAVTKAVTVQSVNGPGTTAIRGYGPIGTAAVRCVYLTNGAVLTGFTLTNGATKMSGTRSGGGVWCESVSAVVSNCIIVSNSASLYGGGAYSGTLYNCTLSGNSGNGAYSSTLNNCTLTSNKAGDGGGANTCTLNNCVLSGNSASGAEGGAGGHGGGAYNSTLNNCTLTGNAAYFYTSAGGNGSGWGGGAYGGTLNNCIVYYNSWGGNYSGGTFNYCCTTPLPSGGTGNTNADPALASASHLSSSSPCRGAGSAAYTSGVDIDGEPWANPPSIGCDEYWSGSVTGALSVAIIAAYTNVPVGFTVDFQGVIGGRTTASSWDFADGVVLSNRPDVSHAWTTAGNYAVVLRAHNESYPDGVAASVTVQVVGVHYVSLSSTSPAWPYGSWATAATNIQTAVDAAPSGATILVSNGVYQTGVRTVYGMSNRVAVTKAVLVQSLNGPAVTSLVGYRMPGTTNGSMAVRCAYLTNGAVLAGFTLTNGATQTSGDAQKQVCGGGVWCESANAVVSNCVIVGNSAANAGGGAYLGTLNNCTLTANSAAISGGACCGSLAGASGTVRNCTLSGNSAFISGGGAYAAPLTNCIVYYNTAPTGPNQYASGLRYCCTTPLPVSGAGNFTNAPLFVDQAGSDLHLQTNSPCINAGSNAYVVGSTDLDGNPRIVGGTVDVGAYECQSPTLLDYYLWLQSYGLPTATSAIYADSDVDGLNNWQEWLAGTNPTNAASVLRLQQTVVLPAGVTLTWKSVTNRAYFVERATNLMPPPAFSLLETNIPGLPDTTSFTDTNSPVSGPAFYRVGVQP